MLLGLDAGLIFLKGNFKFVSFANTNTTETNYSCVGTRTHESVDRYFFNTNDAMTFLKEDVPNLG